MNTVAEGNKTRAWTLAPELGIPPVAWCLAVLRDSSGAVVARQRVVSPEQ